MAEEDINQQISYNTELKAFSEKFAELIVRECMYVGRLSQINNGIVDSDIKEHFGVE